MARGILAGLVGGVIVFFWGAVSHMALPLGMVGVKSIPNENAVLQAMTETIQEPGLYYFPGYDRTKPMSKADQDAWAEKARTGPSGLLVVTPTGGEAMTPKQLFTEFASNVLSALLAAYLVAQVAGGYWSRVRFLVLIGLFGWLTIQVSYWNWFKYPTDYTLAAALEEAIGWFLAGLAIATIVKPKAAVTTDPGGREVAAA